MLPLVLVGDEQRLGAGEHLTEANRESESDGEQDVSGEEMKCVYEVSSKCQETAADSDEEKVCDS